ncbi:hypothetical protein KGF56_002642 [Candida oxycetoniae]|uniref:N-acetyltransferase domain-containing protein n=1 Tax=Candida oxycetoniae TaxID=497107 RepID=A0AAI9WXS3_9ASCO|nr:uncharacterized protein KGF56_002642 [Candida oxycetoniae]KAI3404543.1 hypothetical protein KGF56_002642 [Candida oxycetoniae]
MSEFPPNLSIRPLTIEDLDQCVELESKGFSEEERCPAATMRYRLTVAPELCSGLFIRDFEWKYNLLNLPEVARQVEREHDESKNHKEMDEEEFPGKSSVTKETLVGHIIATKIAGTRISEASMQLPTEGVQGSGHIESSRIIGVHSVVIEPKWRGKNLAALLLHDYIQKLSNQDVGDQLVLIVHEKLIPFYEKMGFSNLGESACKHANTKWYDMAVDLVSTDDL